MIRILPLLLLLVLSTALLPAHAASEPAPAPSQPSTSPSDKTSLAFAEVERVASAMAAEQSAFREAILQKQGELTKLGADLDSIGLNENTNQAAELTADYSQANVIWEIAVDRILALFSGMQAGTTIDIPEQVQLQSFSSDQEKSRYKDYLATYRETLKKQRLFADERTRLLNDLKATNFNLLSQAGSIRANLLQACDQTPRCDRSRGLNSRNLKDTLRELRAVPLRTEAGLLTKYLEIKDKAASGIDGWLDLFFQAVLLGIILVIPFALRRMLQWVSRQLDVFRQKMLARSMLDPRQRTRVAMMISRMNPFIPSLGLILSAHLAKALLETTDLEVLAVLLTYLLIFFYYQAFHLLLGILLEMAFSTSSVNHLNFQHEEIEKSARRISALVFVEYAILQLIEDTVRTGLIYNLFTDLIFWVNIVFVIVESRRWREDISKAFARRFTQLWPRIRSAYDYKLGNVITPLLLLTNIVHDVFRLITLRLVKLDFMKQILSEIFKHRLDQANKEAEPKVAPPQEYLAVFDYYLPARDDFFIDRESSCIPDTLSILTRWIEGKGSDDLLIIVGDRGMGKTTVLKKLHDSTPQTQHKTLCKIPARTLSHAALYEWLSEATQSSIGSLEDFVRFDAGLSDKLILFVDEIHNLFISKVGGFEAYRLFIEIINLNTHNVFWCLTANTRSWSYLKGVFGLEHFYGKVLNIHPWQDYEIQRLILARHELTQYRRTFDDAISAYAGGDALGQQMEIQFFRLLWGQSRGNPRSALMYWQSAISAPHPAHIHVGIPEFVNSSLVSSMSDDALFLFASIARHESLTMEEMEQTTEIDKHVIRRNLKEAKDKGLIWFDPNGRARVSSRNQYVIDYYLIGKNFLHE